MFGYCGNNPTCYTDPLGYLRYDVATCSVADADWGRRAAAFLEPIYYHNDGFINGQGTFAFAQEAFGLGTYANNGCGTIAVYNAMQLLGKPTSLGMITDELINIGGLIAGGTMGITPGSIRDYFISRGISCDGYVSFDSLSNNVQEGSIIIFVVLNNAHTILGGAHYMAAQYCGGQYNIYNMYNDWTGTAQRRSLCQPYGYSGYLYGYIIGG